jgi:hypothetical protein
VFGGTRESGGAAEIISREDNRSDSPLVNPPPPRGAFATHGSFVNENTRKFNARNAEIATWLKSAVTDTELTPISEIRWLKPRLYKRSHNEDKSAPKRHLILCYCASVNSNETTPLRLR